MNRIEEIKAERDGLDVRPQDPRPFDRRELDRIDRDPPPASREPDPAAHRPAEHDGEQDGRGGRRGNGRKPRRG